MMHPHTLFISDLHLQPTAPEISRLFLLFLANHVPQADALYILGDLFEAWIGDDDNDNFNQTIINALKRTSADTPIYIMRGNRDFLIGKNFVEACGAKLLADPCKINLYDREIVLTHGDLLCTEDKQHLRFRKIAHNPKYYRWFLMLPIAWRKFIANKIRHTSKNHTAKIALEIMDANPSAAIDLMQKFNVNFMIHGHTHRPLVHQDQNLTRAVLDTWHSRGNYLYFDEAGQFELKWFDAEAANGRE